MPCPRQRVADTAVRPPPVTVVCDAVRMLAHQLLLVLVTTDHLMAAGFLQTLRRAVVAFLAVVFAVGLLAGGTLGFFLGRAAGRRG